MNRNVQNGQATITASDNGTTISASERRRAQLRAHPTAINRTAPADRAMRLHAVAHRPLHAVAADPEQFQAALMRATQE